ncbi:hypothetical protein GCM10027193_03680 [Arenimonas aestuarii]
MLLLALGVGAHKAFFAERAWLPLGAREFSNPYPPGSALYDQHQSFVDRANADPKLRERFARTLDSRGLYAELQLAMARGAQSLDAATVVGATRAMAAVIPRLPEQSCAKLMRPRNDFDEALGRDVRAAFERLPPRRHREFLEFYLQALKAEAHGLPRLPVDPEARRRALGHLGDAYPGTFGQRLQGVLSNPSRASDEDACWAVNSLTHTSTQLDPESREVLSRLIWGGEG